MSLLKKLAVTIAMAFTFMSGGTRALFQAAANSSNGGSGNGGSDTAPDHSDSGGSCK